MNKLKNVIHLLLPIVIAIYQVYLVDRIWNISNKISLFLFIIIICFLYICFYLLKKNIKFSKLNKKNIIIISLLSLLLTAIIMNIDFDFFVKKYRDVNITISQDVKENSQFSIKSIVVDNVTQNVQKFHNINEVNLYYKEVKDVSILFEKNENEDANIMIQENDEPTINVSLKEINYQYDVKSNAIMSPFSIIRFILSFVMIEILSITICLVSYYMYKEDKTLILPILTIVAILRIIFYKQCSFFIMTPDSYEYKNFDFNALFSGKLQGRVPIYPLVLSLLTYICNASWANFVTILQIIISFVSLIFLYKILKMLIRWEILRGIIVFLYGVSVAIIGWDTLILTESISLSATIFFVYFIIKYIKYNILRYGIITIIWTFLMIFLRPSFIILIAILLLFFILKLIFEKKNRKNDMKCIIICVIEILLIFIYASMFYKQYEIFSISDASLRQDLYVCINEEFYKNSENEQFINDIEISLEKNSIKWNAMLEILSNYASDYGNKRTQELISISKRNSCKEYIEYIRRIILENAEIYFNGYQILSINTNNINEKYNFIKSFNFLKFSTVYYIIIIECIINLYEMSKKRKIDWIHLGLFGITLSIVFVAFVGTNGEFMRTAICVVPLSYISIGTIAGEAIEKYKRE